MVGHQTIVSCTSYISEGLHRDEAQFDQYTARKLADALKRRGVAEKVLQEAMAEITHDS
jgi:predicted NAD/FAD-binding protein